MSNITEDKNVETPLMKQFYDIKKEYPGTILLFRVGDFYETFGEDAIFASKALNIVLTKRANGTATGVELAGFPHHALETYLHKLVKAGGRVAICEQLEDPKTTKKLVKRGVTELITPGVTLDDKLLDTGKNNFLSTVYIGEKATGLALLDVSTGEFFVTESSWKEIVRLVNTFSPSEILLSRGQQKAWAEKMGSSYYTTKIEDWVFKSEFAEETLFRHFNVHSLKGFGVEDLKLGQIAAAACLYYLAETKHELSCHISKIQRLVEDTFLWMDTSTIRNLELLKPVQAGIDEKYSLLGVLNNTVTSMGSRLLRRYICMPLQKKEEIELRHSFVEELTLNPSIFTLFKDEFKTIGDLERLVSKVASLRANPREIQQIELSLSTMERIKNKIVEDTTLPQIFKDWVSKIDVCTELQVLLAKSLQVDPPISISKGMVIAPDFNAELDELRKLVYSGKDYLAELQQREANRSGISTLKLGFNSVFGYYLEATHLNKDKVPSDWIRKQTLANGERYITAELKEYEEKVLHAQEKMSALEAVIYEELIRSIQPYIETLQSNAQAIAFADVMLSFALAAKTYKYVRPEITNGLEIEIKDGRHPVIERFLPEGNGYVPNDLLVDDQNCQIMMITGPNMSGKSAVLRQTALIVLMAQMGSFVPATCAKIGLVDKVFTRVGASDNIASGESTFMVEMNETSNILNNITSRSLVLLDEIGRGTSTYDGISIAWAIAEYLHQNDKIRPKVLFATHYHELNQMANTYERIKNYHISVKELDEEVIFLRKLVPGGSEHSFGIHVARMAGMPNSVINRAEEILDKMEKTSSLESNSLPDSTARGEINDSNGHKNTQTNILKGLKTPLEDDKKGYQLSFIQLEDPLVEKIKNEVLGIDINSLTPLEALNKLNEIKGMLRKSKV